MVADILKRIFASIIDKVIILVSFFLVYSLIIYPIICEIEDVIMINAGPREIGMVVGILDAHPYIYRYFDYPIIETDLKVVYSFVVFNLFYYMITEISFKASLGKRILGFVMVEADEDVITWSKAFARNLLFGFMMIFFVKARLVFDATYIGTIIVFFVILDISVLFCNRNLIDILTRTYCMNKNTKQQVEEQNNNEKNNNNLSN